MKPFEILMDITVSRTLYVDAVDEEDARQKAIRKVKNEPFWQAAHADSFVECSVSGICRIEDD